uniref:Uncharacterized protein n=1 Tax=Anguilla anguilla TaxID=7936 RepID=A0A0E9UFF3_ANGAN
MQIVMYTIVYYLDPETLVLTTSDMLLSTKT